MSRNNAERFGQSLAFTTPAIAGQVLEVNSALDFVNVSPKSFPTSIDDGDSPYTTLATDEFIYADATAGVITVSLALSTTMPKGFRLRVIAENATSDITVAKTGADTLTEINSRNVLQNTGEYIDLVTDGATGWWVVGFGTIAAEV